MGLKCILWVNGVIAELGHLERELEKGQVQDPGTKTRGLSLQKTAANRKGE